MGPRRLRNCFSRRNNRFHRLVRGEFPAHADREGIKTAGEARPEDDAVRRRITRCHAERERVRIEADLAIGGAGCKRLRNTERCENLQEPAAADHGESISGPCFRVLTRGAASRNTCFGRRYRWKRCPTTRSPARSSTARKCTRPSSATSRSCTAPIGWHSFALTSQIVSNTWCATPAGTRTAAEESAGAWILKRRKSHSARSMRARLRACALPARA